MTALALVLSIAALGICIWLAREVAGLRERWARLYGLKAAMVETETALQDLMRELDNAGKTLIAELDRRLSQAHESGSCSAGQGFTVSGPKTESAGSREDAEDKRAAVIALVQQGYTVEEIAREMKIPRGEVQLILDLERFRQ